MKAVILGAGYGQRLVESAPGGVNEELSNTPKGLLEVGGMPVLSHLVSKISEIESVDEIILITNSRFFEAYNAWSENVSASQPYTIRVLNDLTDSNDNRAGALVDLCMALGLIPRKDGARFPKVQDDVIVLATDRLFDFSLADFVSYFNSKGTSVITRYDVGDKERVKRSAEVAVDSAGRVISFTEKPDDPETTCISPAFYIYGQQDLPRLPEYLGSAGENLKLRDAPGHFPQWLVRQSIALHAYEIPAGSRLFDIGTYGDLLLTREALK